MLGPDGPARHPIPEDEGGAGLDTLAYAIAVEELARVWGSLALIVAAHTSLKVAARSTQMAGSEEQKQRFLVPLAQGRQLGAYGLTEPEAGSDSGGTRTTAAARRRQRWRAAVGHQRRESASSPTPDTRGRTSSRREPGPRADGSPEISAFIVPGRHSGLLGRADRAQARPSTRAPPAS